ncbi:MAG: CapA family protein, partial [Gemmatimonadota bacterium]
MDRRRFLGWLGAALAAPVAGDMTTDRTPLDAWRARRGDARADPDDPRDVDHAPRDVGPVTLFLAGDVMTGRGIDQALPRSVDPRLYESYVKDARDYLRMAERASGPIPAPVDLDYVWGDALAELERVRPDARIINLETAVTTHDEPWPGKGIHYRMHPGNAPVLAAAGIDVCGLANNHVLDWGRPGLEETLGTIRGLGIGTAGAGANRREAAEPAVVDTGKGRVRVHAYGTAGAGVPSDWAAAEARPGVNLLPRVDAGEADRVADGILAQRTPGDRVVVSIHWGPNWGYDVPRRHREFAHRLVDAGAADVIHGHSSHHPMGIEIYRDRPILYGAGDFLNDYEGIRGREKYRGELALMYFPT